jgi:hypothetical protein
MVDEAMSRPEVVAVGRAKQKAAGRRSGAVLVHDGKLRLSYMMGRKRAGGWWRLKEELGEGSGCGCGSYT